MELNTVHNIDFYKMKKITLIALILIIFSSCASTFDQTAYNNALKAKKDVLSVVSNGNDTYSNHAVEIDSIAIQLDSYYEYEQTRSNNKFTIELWRNLIKENGIIYKTFTLWKKQGRLSIDFVKIRSDKIKQRFDDILTLELKKK